MFRKKKKKLLGKKEGGGGKKVFGTTRDRLSGTLTKKVQKKKNGQMFPLGVTHMAGGEMKVNRPIWQSRDIV